MQNEQEKLFLVVDGMALVFRGFYAIPKLTTHDGKNTNALVGFYMILLNLIKQVNPTHIAICFDLRGKTKRKEKFDEYKATRKKAPDELYEQIPYIKEGIAALQLNLLEKEGYEADDLIATIATENHAESISTVIYTGDLDILQLANDTVKILTPHNQREGKLMGRTEVIEKYGFTPEQIPDYKGLHGDPSDNLPGVRGVGKKTATKLLTEYQTLEGIYENLADLSEKMRAKFEEHRELSFLCKELATLHTDLEYETPGTEFAMQALDFGAGFDFFSKYAMRRQFIQLKELEDRLSPDASATNQKEEPAPIPEESAPAPEAVQTSLF